MSSSNCCFLTCIQVFQEAGQVVWYSHLFQNFPQFIVIHTVKGFGIVNKAEIDIFWNSLPFSMIQQMLSIWSLVPLTFLKPAWTSGYAKSLQSYPTLCNPRDGSPPGSPVPGILQARTLEWVAISFSNAWKWKVKVESLSCVRLFATPWTAAYQAPPSMGFSRQEYWSGVPLPSPWTSGGGL